MHTQTLHQWQHDHDFTPPHDQAEKNTRRVMALTAVTMVAEIIAGSLFASMALLADGWHMATHVAAFGITMYAYHYARAHARNPRFTFGTGKVGVLGGFASAVALAVVALVMALESAGRMIDPQTIRFNEAIAVATLGLLVNLVCGWLLHDCHGHAHHHDHDHGEGHGEHHHDHNLRAAYFHVLADALTSVFAIVALLGGKFFGWVWLDPLMGLVGALMITRWAYGLMRETSAILLDGTADEETRAAITAAIEEDADNRVADLHLWQVGPHTLAASLSVVTHWPRPAAHYKALLQKMPRLAHVTVEVNSCESPPCLPGAAPAGQGGA
ncbi:MAG: CDF family Co(II)/Ni(II) efflux transporter DmeF [Thermodesulfobacteriota bacterium]|jgi:cation diffusion facilitator family transporter